MTVIILIARNYQQMKYTKLLELGLQGMKKNGNWRLAEHNENLLYVSIKWTFFDINCTIFAIYIIYCTLVGPNLRSSL